MLNTTLYGEDAVATIVDRGDLFSQDGFCMGFITPRGGCARVFIGQVDTDDGRLQEVGKMQIVLVHRQYEYDVLTERAYWEHIFMDPEYCTENFVISYCMNDNIDYSDEEVA